MISEQLPTEITQAYFAEQPITVERLSGGQVNETWLVTDTREKSILQSMSDVLRPETIQDAVVICQHMEAQGWTVPTLLPATNGRLSTYDDSGRLWRRLRFIQADDQTPPYSLSLLVDAGQLLGSWHRAVSSLSYQPQFGLPHFHDTAYHAQKTAEYVPLLPDTPARKLAGKLLERYEHLPEPGEQQLQLIHGDPKLDNMLYCGGKPFTLIDFDTVMQGSPWTDVGDLLRSLIGKQLAQNSGHRIVTQPFIDSYRLHSRSDLSPEDSRASALQATRRIAIELGMRYLCDVVDDQYFTWDKARYESRRDNHFDRAALQLRIAETALQSYIKSENKEL